MESRTQKISEKAIAGNAQQLNPGCARLIGLPFFLIGSLFALAGLSMFYTWFKSASWPIAKATIVSAEIKKHSASGKSGSTYSLEGSFTYSYNDQKYTSTQFEIESGSSSAHNEKRELLDQLQAAMRDNREMDAYVNPNDPGEAFIFRRISLGMIMFTTIGGLFAMVGLCILTGLFTLINPPSIDQNRLKMHPREPWLADSRWQGFSIKTSSWKSLIVQFAFSFFMTIFISVFVVALFTDSSAPIFAFVIVGIFAFIAVAMLVHSIYKTMQYLKFKESTLLLSQTPLCGGCEFMAVLAVEPRFNAGQVFEFELVCERKLVTRSGKNSHTQTDTLHKSSFQATAGHDSFRNNKIFVAVKLNLPEKIWQVTDSAANPSITWKLLASASVPGVDYAAEFSLPVYEVSDPQLIKHKK